MVGVALALVLDCIAPIVEIVDIKPESLKDGAFLMLGKAALGFYR
jgi:hypothetical protein